MDIYELLKKYERYTAFTYGRCNDEDIIRIEEMLNVKLPDDYIRYIKTFGGGGISGMEIMGVGANGSFTIVEATKMYRQRYGLPQNLIVVECSDEWVYCIDTSNGKVLLWCYDGFHQDDSNSFQEFLIDRVSGTIENMIYSGEIQEDE